MIVFHGLDQSQTGSMDSCFRRKDNGAIIAAGFPPYITTEVVSISALIASRMTSCGGGFFAMELVIRSNTFEVGPVLITKLQARKLDKCLLICYIYRTITMRGQPKGSVPR